MRQWAKFMRPIKTTYTLQPCMLTPHTYIQWYTIIKITMVGDTILTHNEGTKYTDLS